MMTWDWDWLISILNGSASALIAFGLAAAVLSKRVNDGVVIKVGLSCMALGFVVIAVHMLRIWPNVQGVTRAMLLVNLGIAVVILGYIFRYRSAGHALRRITDWADLDEEMNVESREPEDDRRKPKP